MFVKKILFLLSALFIILFSLHFCECSGGSDLDEVHLCPTDTITITKLAGNNVTIRLYLCNSPYPKKIYTKNCSIVGDTPFVASIVVDTTLFPDGRQMQLVPQP